MRFVRGAILDSPFGDLRANIRNFVKSKAAKVPDVVIDMALAIIDSKLRIKKN